MASLPLANGIKDEDVIEWDAAAREVVSSRRMPLGALVLRKAPLRDPQPDREIGALLEGIRRTGSTRPGLTAPMRRCCRICLLGAARTLEDSAGWTILAG